MEENLRQLSEHLSQASTLLTSVLGSTGGPSDNISRSNTSARQPSLASSGIAAAAIGTNISGAVARARSMMTHSASQGVYSRLNQRERLRASTSSSAIPHRNKRQKKEVETKAFEFVLMNITLESESWAIAEENIALRGLIEITTNSKEADIRQAIGKATRQKFSMISNDDFEFLRATRRKLSKPVCCQAFDYKQLKLLAGQGSIYVKLKDGMDCLLVRDDDDNDEGIFH